MMLAVIWGIWLLVNLFVFALYGADKQRAKRGAWRISEKTLLSVAALLGAPGALAGMYTFRHKTKHIRFKAGLPVMAVIQLAVLFGLK